MIRNKSALAIGASLVFLGSSALTANHAQASNLPQTSALPTTLPSEEDPPSPTFLELDFAHPVSLESATTVVDGGGVPISGYHFASDSIIGDFWPEGGLSVEEFLAEVEEKTGTAPEIVAAYVDAALYAERRGQQRSAPPLLGASLPVFEAPAADPSLAATDRPEDSSDWSPHFVSDETWQPSEAEVMIQPMGDNLAISTKYHWQGVNPFASPLVMADHWGLEFQVDFYSSRVVNSPLPPPHNRPNCGTSTVNYKDWAAASNRPFDWFGWVISGSSHIAAPGALGLYGDYNVEAQSTVGAIVQPVSRNHCEIYHWLPLTDCMGVTSGAYPGPGPASSRMVLNSANNNKAPSLCWYSPSFGTTPAQLWTC